MYEPATGGGAQVHVRWQHGGAANVRLLRRAETLPLGPFDPSATVVYAGNAEEITHRARELVALEVSFYAAFACDDAGGCETFGVQVPFELTIMQALVDGGYAIYLRHAIADVCADALTLGPAATTSSPGWWKSCDQSCGTATAAQLGAAGIAQATMIGDALTTRAVPISRVHTSELCRAVQTAQLLSLPGVTITTDAALTYFVYDEADRCGLIATELAVPPDPGANALYVGHAGFAGPCDPLASLAEGEAMIYRVEPAAIRRIQTVSATAWASLP